MPYPGRFRLGWRLHLGRVARPMVLNLERQKCVDSFQRLLVMSHNRHLPAPRGRCVDFRFETGERNVLVLEQRSALYVDCVDQYGHELFFQYSDAAYAG